MKTNIQSMPQQRHINRIASIALAGMIGLLGAATSVHAQTDYPNRPIKVVVPYTAGGNATLPRGSTQRNCLSILGNK